MIVTRSWLNEFIDLSDVSCEKHPDADKLNVCQIDVGSGTRQIVCGAANVVDAEYVAVATIGAVLPGDFPIPVKGS
jgi:phenylalanyl-tRNA synthetase beta chain